MWGFCGILSLGQGAFLGLGGYAYGIAGINLIESHGHTWAALGIGLAVPVLVAALLGFIMFYARLRGVYVAILMLVVTLLLETFLNQTAGQSWFIGEAHLGGNNGLGRFSGVIREPPSLSFGLGSDIEFNGRTRAFYYLTFGLVVVVYLGLRCLVNSKAGRVMIAIREDAERTEALGYDIRLIQARRVLPGRLPRRALRHPLRLVGEFHHAVGLRRAEQHPAGDLGRRLPAARA